MIVMSLPRGAFKEAQRLSGRNLKVQHRKTAMMVTVPSLAKQTDFPTEEGSKVKPYEMRVEDPDTGEEKPGLVFIPE